MTWVKIDDRYATHRKMLRAGPLALALDVAGMCYCAGHGTDGYVPTEAIAAAAPFLTKRQAATALDALVAAGRWKPAKGGWLIHDYLTYNPSAAEAAKERWRRAENTRKWRERQSGDRSPHDAGDDAVIPARPLGGYKKPKGELLVTPPPRDPSPDPPDTPPPTVGAAADDDGPEPPTNVPRLSAQLRAETAARTLAAHGIDNGQTPPPPATRPDVDPAEFEAERRRQLDALKATSPPETDTP